MFALAETGPTLDDVAAARVRADAAEAEFVTMVAAYDRSGRWHGDGFASAAAAVRHRCHVTPRVAAATVHLARTLEQVPAVRMAFARGEISRAHAQVVVNAC